MVSRGVSGPNAWANLPGKIKPPWKIPEYAPGRGEWNKHKAKTDEKKFLDFNGGLWGGGSTYDWVDCM